MSGAVFRICNVLIGIAFAIPAMALPSDDRPNILLIMADDIGIDGIGCYGGESYETLRVDRLAEEGMRFTHAYSQPLCTPTRVQLMTGRYNHRNWLYFGILDPRERTFGHLMQGAGYRTAIAGKWQLQSYDPPDFPHAERRRGTGMKVEDAGFDEWLLYHAGHTEDKGSRYADPSYEKNGELVGPVAGGYGPDESVAFLSEFMTRESDEPFFAYFAMALPHWPMVPTPDSEEWADHTRRLEESTDYFADMVGYMDKAVGRLLDSLAESGQAANTVVIFYSDNGTDKRIVSRFRGESVTGGKASTKQTGIRVPLIVRWPEKVAAGTTTDALVDASDFVPTLVELSGAEMPEDWFLDGKSFLPVMTSGKQSHREAAFFWYDPRPGWDKESYSRRVFALDHDFKVFSDGRIFDVSGEGFREVELDPSALSNEAKAARMKLLGVIERTMKGPISDAAKVEVNAFGEPVR